MLMVVALLQEFSLMLVVKDGIFLRFFNLSSMNCIDPKRFACEIPYILG